MSRIAISKSQRQEVKLPESLPSSYATNLCDLPQDKQDAIEEDKERWYIALTVLQEKNRDEIVEWLNLLKQDHLREDFRRRLNHIKGERKKAKQNHDVVNGIPI